MLRKTISKPSLNSHVYWDTLYFLFDVQELDRIEENNGNPFHGDLSFSPEDLAVSLVSFI